MINTRSFYNNVEDVRNAFRGMKKAHLYTSGRGGPTFNIQGASFIADEIAIFGKPNHEYIEAEIAWYESLDRNIKRLGEIYGSIPAQWKMTADNEGEVNSNYGYIIFGGNPDLPHQYNEVLDALQKDPSTRRASMIYTRPDIWFDFDHNNRNDFICTNTVDYGIIGGEVTATVHMRSNDAIFGYKNDFAWQKYVLDKLVDDLNDASEEEKYIPGRIYWCATSLHVYERHWDLIE